MLGGIATLLEVMLLDSDLRVVHVPGPAVNRARRGTRGGEHKSDPKDAMVIADQVRMRDDLRIVTTMREDDVELQLLVRRRSEIVADQTRLAARTVPAVRNRRSGRRRRGHARTAGLRAAPSDPYSRLNSISGGRGPRLWSVMVRTHEFQRRIASSFPGGRIWAALSNHSIASVNPS